ncbi:hypothetical protein [Bartonella sp. DGB2]|uniref:hypothetical protein n=1 Tax=Bartonella sp. DGB2 TaxID=3388426 RepID=UPI0039900C5F
MHKLRNPKEDFRVFLFFVWKHPSLPPPTWSQYILAEWLATGSNRLVIQAFCGVGKSFAAAYVCWRLLRLYLKINCSNAPLTKFAAKRRPKAIQNIL